MGTTITEKSSVNPKVDFVYATQLTHIYAKI